MFSEMLLGTSRELLRGSWVLQGPFNGSWGGFGGSWEVLGQSGTLLGAALELLGGQMLGRSKHKQLCRKLVLSTKAGSQDNTEDMRYRCRKLVLSTKAGSQDDTEDMQ